MVAVWLTERDVDVRAAETVLGGWLRRGADRRAVVVTWRPTALRGLVDAHGGHLVVLPPPVFGWQLVDALRASDRGSEAP